MNKLCIASIIVLLTLFMVPMFATAEVQGLPVSDVQVQTTGAEEESLDLETIKERVGISTEDFYYYDKERQKVYLNISEEKFVVVFDPEVQEEHLKLLLQESDFLIDAYIWENDDDFLKYNTVVVFKLSKECTMDCLIYLLNHFNKRSIVKYASPVIIINGKDSIIQQKFEMKVKTQAQDRIRDIKRENGIILSKGNMKDLTWGQYWVDLDETKMNYFQLVNFFAQDKGVVYAIPLFLELAAPLTVKQEIELDGAKVGEKLRWVVTIERDEKCRIDPSSLGSLTIPSTEFIKYHLPSLNKTDIVEGTKLVAEGYIQIFAPGDYTIKPIKIAYLTEEGKGKEVASNRIVIRIASLIPKESVTDFIARAPLGEFHPKVNPEDKESDARNFLVAAIFLAGVSAFLFLKVSWSAIKGLFAGPKTEETDPMMDALVELESLISATNTDKEYFLKVDGGLRKVLSLRTGFDFSSGTIKSVMENLEDKKLAKMVEPVLRICEKALSMEDLDISLKNELEKSAEMMLNSLKTQ